MAAVILAEWTAFLARGQHGKGESQGQRKEQHQTWTSPIFYRNETEHRYGGTESALSAARTVNLAEETRSVRTHVRHFIDVQRLTPILPTPRWVWDTKLRRGQKMGPNVERPNRFFPNPCHYYYHFLKICAGCCCTPNERPVDSRWVVQIQSCFWHKGKEGGFFKQQGEKHQLLKDID